MQSAEVVGLALLLAIVVLIVAVAIRRSLLSRAGGVDLCWRPESSSRSRGWVFGQGRFSDTALVLYRSFSPLPLASRTLDREDLEIGARRSPTRGEADLLPVGSVIVRCNDGRQPFEMALSEQSLTGLQAWLESVPPALGQSRGRQARG
ncbi:DUF2550 domain-containing protein [Nakamurella endophytica]|uniref:DUF2550 family protein n=1 Tax=Nakamurella endophytica TaxID=1748367 RepID=A0A917TD35_9ACTN|nr:DUF2550 domain-containing protein [Nakamurella endophytica]GGM17913.1 hypothetical protein GCM10011594_42560 [Nakamurella endophytica]